MNDELDAKEYVMSLPVEWVIAFTSPHMRVLYYRGGTNWTWDRSLAVKFSAHGFAVAQNKTLSYPQLNRVLAFFK